MSVLIKGMDIPKSCSDCPLNYDEMSCAVTGTRWWSDTMVLLDFDYTKERLYDCPLSEVPSTQPEPCEDAVSRRMAIDAVKASAPFCVVPDDHHISAVDMEFRISKLPSVTPRPESCEDAVSRKELLKLFSNNTEGSWTYDTVAIGYIKALPSVMPERHTCDTCKHYPPSKKWPCVDCNMRNPTDRWETDMR